MVSDEQNKKKKKLFENIEVSKSRQKLEGIWLLLKRGTTFFLEVTFCCWIECKPKRALISWNGGTAIMAKNWGKKGATLWEGGMFSPQILFWPWPWPCSSETPRGPKGKQQMEGWKSWTVISATVYCRRNEIGVWVLPSDRAWKHPVFPLKPWRIYALGISTISQDRLISPRMKNKAIGPP